jgi:hypothetical protein
MKYFWYYRPEENFPPLAVSRPDQLVGKVDRLSVWCTQTGLPPADQRKLVRDWCHLLPNLGDVRFLWLSGRVPQDLFDAACRMTSLDGLCIKWSGAHSIDALREIRALRYFHLGSSTGVQSIDCLSKLDNLRWLDLENLKRIRDFEPVGELTNLEGLALTGSVWTTQRVRTLAPIAKLTNLRYLSLANLRSDDKTLAPLYSLQNLEVFIAANWWDQREFAEIRRRNPRLRAELDPESESGSEAGL